LGDPRAGRRIALDEIGQAGQHDSPDHAIGQGIAEGGGGGEGFQARMTIALLGP
jgi:hypothetical protein